MKTPEPTPIEVLPRPGKEALVVDSSGRADIEKVAQYFDMRPGLLTGLLMRNALHDPLGNVVEGWCYAWSVEQYLKNFGTGEP